MIIEKEISHMSGSAQMDVKSASGKKNHRPKTLDRMGHKRSANGGHVFTHHYNNDGPTMGIYHEPEEFTFGADEGGKALAHFTKHAGIKMGKGKKKDDAAEEKAESKAEEAAEGEE